MKWSGKLNRNYMQISAYVIATAVIIYILALLAKNAPEITNRIFDKLGWILTVVKPIGLGFVFAYLLEPVVNFIERHLKKRKHFVKHPQKVRMYAVVCTILMIVVGFCALISILVYSVTRQIRLANVEDVFTLFNTYINMFSSFITSLIDKLTQLNIETKELQQLVGNVSNFLGNFLKNFLNSAAGSIGNISGNLTTLVFAIIIGIWFMIDGSMITGYLNKVMYALVSEKGNRKVHAFLHDADTVFSGYIRGQLMDAFVMMFLISVSLSLIGVKFSVLIGVVAGIGNLIPYVGPFIAYGGSIIVCLLNGDYKTLVIAIIALFIIQTIDGNFIGPKLLSQSIEIHPLLVIVFLIFGSAIGGLLGMLFAVPVGALIKVLFVRFIDNRVAKKEKAKEMAADN